MPDPYTAAVDYLFSRINYERMPSPPYAERHMKLDRMRQLLNLLQQPAAGIPTVHIAGTKGKGSTSALLAGIVQAANYRVGVFSSPHLERIEERFVVDGQPCSPEELVALVEQVRPAVDRMDERADAFPEAQLRPTFFEIATAIAFLYFANKGVDLVILEVGLGGRLDSTNVCSPCCTVITSISYDHMKQLGNTLPEIAAEKAGIVKPGVPLVTGPLQQEAYAVIASIALQRGARISSAGHHFTFQTAGRTADSESPRRQPGRFHFQMQPPIAFPLEEPFALRDVELQLLGEHQIANAAVALATAVELRRQGWLLPESALRAGLANTLLSGRVELISEKPHVVLDVAHNVASVEALVETLQTNFDCPQRHLVFAATKEKDVFGILRVLLPHFDTVTFTKYQENGRAVDVSHLQELCELAFRATPGLSEHLQVTYDADPATAWRKAWREANEEDLICVTGSFFIAAELRPLMLAATSHTRT